MQLPIEDHGLVGDLRTLALVGLDGTIDFLCWPRFDSPSVFASLLDEERGGSFALTPELGNARHRQLYLPDTNVLLTRFLSDDGVAEISDFMTLGMPDERQRLVRRAKAVRGTIRFSLRCAPAFDYARAGGSAREADAREGCHAVVLASDGADGTRLRLVSDTALTLDGDVVVATFELEPGESAFFVLEDADSDGPGGLDGGDGASGEEASDGGAASASAGDGARKEKGGRRPGSGRVPGGVPCAVDAEYVAEAFKATSDFWREWSARGTYRGRWRDAVARSALALKLLTSAEHGSMIAAATFGLPETLGGVRNWDYRFTWIRDAAFTVYGFIRVGHVAEADAFMHWLGGRARHAHEDGPLRVMYGLDGHEELTEVTLDHLDGYRGSRPVRIGNGAADQRQLDIYGELMDAIYLSDKYGTQISHAGWQGVVRSLEWLEHHWQEPDEGIWEVRSGRAELLYSRLMCWVAFDRGLRLADKRSLPAPRERWRVVRDTIHDDIHSRFWSEERGAFVQSAGGHALDASCLLMPLVKFIGPKDPRWLATLARIGEELTDDSLVYRYSLEDDKHGADGLDGIEGTFNMCSFWYVECLARAGEVEQARFLFEKMLGYANHLGLFAEETGAAGDQLGNFPQAFTHLALISAACRLDLELSR